MLVTRLLTEAPTSNDITNKSAGHHQRITTASAPFSPTGFNVSTEQAMSISFDMKIEIVVIPDSDVDRAKRFYGDLGWRLDLDFASSEDDYRVIQYTPPGSGCSIMFGKNMTAATPGSVQGIHLVVSDIVAARSELMRRGIEVSQPFHDVGGVFHHADGKCQEAGPNPDRLDSEPT